MKRPTEKKKTNNTLFSYFQSTKPPAKKQSLTSLIEKTTITRRIATDPTDSKPHSASARISPSPTPSPTSRKAKPIDLTESDDDDLITLPSSLITTVNFSSSQSSPLSSQTSQNSLNTTEIKNTSKYNKKGWSVQAKESGPQRSSQDSSLSQEKQPVQRYQRIVLNKPRITPKPFYDWLGPNDVQPYSSTMKPKASANSNTLAGQRPKIDTQYVPPSADYKPKRGWEATFGSSSNSYDSSPYDGWTQKTETSKKRGFVAHNSGENIWSISKGKKGSSRQRSNNNLGVTMGSLSTPSASPSEYRPDLSPEQQRVLNMVVNEHQSLFFTGSAGTGKSVLLRAIIDKLRTKYGNGLAVTASTGIAACNINGCTLHR